MERSEMTSSTTLNDNDSSCQGTLRNSNRKHKLEKKKAIDELIRAANAAPEDPLASFSSFRRYHNNGLSVYLESGIGDKLSSYHKHYIQTLLKVNMEDAFGSNWPTEEKVKRRGMIAPQARYIFVHETHSQRVDNFLANSEKGGPLVGFVQYRFTVEEEIPVLYVYEIQLEARVQGKGLGKFLMHLIELVALKNHMSAVVLTVQKANVSAMNFYSKLRYIVSSISPSRTDPLMGAHENYEILCKAFDDCARAVLG